jgi:hypothetical protein
MMPPPEGCYFRRRQGLSGSVAARGISPAVGPGALLCNAQANRNACIRELPMNVGPILYVLIIILVILAIVYLFQRIR